MAATDIAFAASAGAIGLALSVTAWAWRYRLKAGRAIAELTGRAAAAEAAVADAQSGAAAFEGCLVAVEGAEARLVYGGETLAACARALGVDAEPDDPHQQAAVLLEALARTAPENAARLKGLLERGEPCRFLIQGEDRVVTVDGRVGGATAWIRLSAGADGLSGGRFAGLADGLPSPVWITDARGALVWANKAWLAAVEAPSVEAARQSGAALDRSVDALVAEAAQLGSRREAFRWITVHGQRRAWRLVAEPLGEGEVAAFAVDVTEAEDTRDALRRHVAAHDETLNHLADAVAIFGPSKRLSFHNTAFQTLFGLDAAWLDERPTHGELLDRLRQRRLLPETAEYPKWKARELDFYGSTEVAPDDEWPLPDGRTLRVVRQPHPLGGLLLLFSDITDELKLRAQYNALIQVQRATLDKLNDAVAVFGSDGRLRLHNESFQSFWNLTAAQIQAAGDFDGVAALCRPLLHDAALWTELKARVADPDPEARVPIAGEARTSDRRIVAWQSRPLPDGATLIAFDDVTARRELERALAQREAALAEAQRLKRDFVGNVSYELRTPLTTIVGYAELMEAQGSGLPERARAHLGAVKSAATQLARSIDDVLDMAQIDAGEMALSLGDVRVCDMLEDAALRARPRLEARGGTLQVSCAEDAGMIRGDARRLAQVLDQLLENAVRATPQGGVVSLAATRAQAEVRIQVSDTGRGIPYHVQAHIFDRFTARDRGGPGLGLALVKALVELHGGWVALESEPGAGATFTVHLPEKAATDAAAPELELGAGG